MSYLAYSTKQTPQSEPIPDTVPNSAGGYSFPVDDWTRLTRFLILGAEGGTYYIGEQKLVRENAQAVERCIALDGLRVVQEIVAVSDSGRAAKNDPALFALAMAAKLGNDETRKAALEALPKVARIGTHLFHFARYIELFGGWGRATRRAIGGWYDREDLALQAIKYQGRDGWTHRDLLRLSHPKRNDMTTRWIVKGAEGEEVDPLIRAFELTKIADTPTKIASLIHAHRLPREAIPSQWLTDASVWAALFEEMPLTAMIRNLATMTRVGLLAPMSDAARQVGERLTEDRLHKARVHPITILAALKTYAQGHGERGDNTWSPVREIVDALDAAFYASFGNVEPTNKRLVFGLDVSGSMANTKVNGIPGLSAREACAAMALVTAVVEKQYAMIAFDTEAFELTISPRSRLDDVVRTISSIGGGGTNCALPIAWAAQKHVPVDAFVILTDSETWQGAGHPVQALRTYRQMQEPKAKMTTVAMCANGFTLGAAKDDAGMLDCIGFDTATPTVISQFING